MILSTRDDTINSRWYYQLEIILSTRDDTINSRWYSQLKMILSTRDDTLNSRWYYQLEMILSTRDDTINTRWYSQLEMKLSTRDDTLNSRWYSQLEMILSTRDITPANPFPTGGLNSKISNEIFLFKKLIYTIDLLLYSILLFWLNLVYYYSVHLYHFLMLAVYWHDRPDWSLHTASTLHGVDAVWRDHTTSTLREGMRQIATLRTKDKNTLYNLCNPVFLFYVVLFMFYWLPTIEVNKMRDCGNPLAT